jgi:endo-1,4-beta-xylanase
MRALRAGLVLVVLALAAASASVGATATARPTPRSTPTSTPLPAPIPEGAALWFACTEQAYVGPLSLRCPFPYDPRYLETFQQGFSRFTPENEFKMAYLEPLQNRFNFTLADQIAWFAIANQKTIRGHTLLWDEENPVWLNHPLLPWNRFALAAVMQRYISTVVGHFGRMFPGVVTEWDVVNEPLNITGHFNSNLWEKVIGPLYIRMALAYAHAADPKARLLINDNAADVPGPKADALLALATSLKQSGAPLDAVGFEAHVSPDTAPTLAQLVSLWRRYAAVGLGVEVTELDVSNARGASDPAAKVAVFERYAEACRLVGNCIGLTVWGVADRYSWLGPTANALLYNADFQPSAAVTLVHDVLSGEPLSVGRSNGGAHRRRRLHGRRARRTIPSHRSAPS